MSEGTLFIPFSGPIIHSFCQHTLISPLHAQLCYLNFSKSQSTGLSNDLSTFLGYLSILETSNEHYN